ncbi:hypothetical protein [Paenarthrobacter nicotinovorans]|uniref:hypothetical protein n=1 Tax=Paenarthrobacter nicotinovorans TaxID=29320 RepID=UPI003DA1FAC1
MLDLQATPGRFPIVLDFVLRQGHPRYASPLPGEQYCYRKGRLVFSGVKEILWSGQGRINPAIDARDEIDYGGIDSFIIEDNVYRLEGDFGLVEVSAASVGAELEEGMTTGPKVSS